MSQDACCQLCFCCIFPSQAPCRAWPIFHFPSPTSCSRCSFGVRNGKKIKCYKPENSSLSIVNHTSPVPLPLPARIYHRYQYRRINSPSQLRLNCQLKLFLLPHQIKINSLVFPFAACFSNRLRQLLVLT